jgi:ubiquinone biosynthesis UbiH/UbiF/VisC/COQ6 family hydroxylase
MEYDLIVVGGGLAGASLVAALRGSHWRIAVVEPRPPVAVPGWDSRIYAISPENVRFLSDMGIWQHLDATRIAPVHAMVIRGDAGGSLEFSAYESGLSELAWIVESGRLHHELWETVRRQHNVTMLCGEPAQRLGVEGATTTLVLADGRQAHARLVVGADGADSWVRQQAGIDSTTVPYGEKGVVANFSCGVAHRDVARQWFRNDGVLAFLPLPGRMMSMVWSTTDARAAELLALDTEALCRRVEAAGELALGHLQIVTPAAAFPLRLLRVATMVRPRVALVGDAAHAIHPLSGHGINLGLQDVRVLAEILRALPPWRDPGDLAVLRQYARARAEEPFMLQYTTHGLNRLFGSDNPLLSLVRNAGLNLTNRLPVVRNALVRYAVSGRF